MKAIKIDKYVFHVSEEDEEAYYKFVEDKEKHFPKLYPPRK